LFTPVSKKLRLSLAAAACVALVYAGVDVALSGVASRAEAAGATYPFRNEDWLRYLLPSLFDGRGEGRILLAGESAVRENLLYDRFTAAFPGLQAFQGGLSLGTMGDVLLALEYIESAYGADAMPGVLVLGVSPRFVADLPARTPLAAGINTYSTRFAVAPKPADAGGPRLKRKSFVQAANAWRKFRNKQAGRYQAALATVALRTLGTVSGGDEAARATSLGAKLELAASPYKFRELPPLTATDITGWMNEPDSFWGSVHAWDPTTDTARVRAQFARLHEIVRRHDIELYVINLPENRLSRERYEPENYQRYLDLVRACVGEAPFLDIREMLDESDFYDIVHATPHGAAKVTQRVIEFVKSARHHRTSADGAVADAVAGGDQSWGASSAFRAASRGTRER
jgi:hypothetical protein